MAKHNVSDKVRHSRLGDGEIIAVRTEVRTPDPIDKVKLDGERWNLKARLAQIEQILERGTDPKNHDVYKVQFADRTMEFEEGGIDKLKERLAEGAKVYGDAPSE